MSRDSDPERGGAPLPDPSPDPERASSTQEQERISAFLKELARSPAGDPRDAFAGFRVGERVGKFELLREMGRGGFGVVYEALDLQLGRTVAFKAVRPGRPGAGEKGEQWLHAEAKAAARLSHPNIITLHDFGTCPAGPYLVMEMLRGETLERRMNHGPLPPKEAIRIGVEVARALCHAHAGGVLHRDVKPSNVFLTRDGAVKVLDFGLARVLGTAGPGGGGTPAFMAPEQWLGGEEDERTDIFSAAAVLFQTLTGELPFAVTRERSAVLDPGRAPDPKRPGVPRQLAALVRSALSRDPADRPRNAQVWLDGLLAAQRTMSRRDEQRSGLRLQTGAGVLALAAVAALLWILRPAPPGARIPVVIADMVNHTQESDLGTLSGMVVTALEQSKRFDILTRWRTLDLLRKEGLDRPEVIDERLARAAGGIVGASAVLVPSVRCFGDTYVLEIQAIDLKEDRYLFTRQQKGAGRASIPGSIDRLAHDSLVALKEGEADLRGRAVEVGRALTANLEAYEHYHKGVACNQRPGSDQATCVEEFRRAVAKDPEFTLAHYRLALATQYRPDLADERKAAIARARSGLQKLPAKERALVRAYAEHVDGRDDAALALYREVLRDYPSDKEALYLAGDILHHQSDLPGAVGYFERALDLDPGLALDQSLEWPLDHLPGDLGRLARRERLQQLAAQWSTAPPSAPVLRALAMAQLWLGRPGQAAAAADQAVKAGGGDPAVRDLAAARFFAGDVPGAVSVLRAASGSGPWLAWLEAAQGRRAGALRALPADDPSTAFYRSALQLGGEPGALWEDARRYRTSGSPIIAAHLAIPLAYRDDLEHAAEIARGLAPGSPGEAIYRAVVAWKRGAVAAARAELAAVERRDLLPPYTLAPSFLLGEVAAAAGDDAAAIEALTRYRSLPYFGIWQGWAWPRSLYLLARAHQRLGQRKQALARAEELVALLRDADPGAPLAAEARALRELLRRGEGGRDRPVSPP